MLSFAAQPWTSFSCSIICALGLSHRWKGHCFHFVPASQLTGKQNGQCSGEEDWWCFICGPLACREGAGARATWKPWLTDGALAALTLPCADISRQTPCRGCLRFIRIFMHSDPTPCPIWEALSAGSMAQFDRGQLGHQILRSLSHTGRLRCTVTNNNIVMVVGRLTLRYPVLRKVKQ